MQKLKNRLYDIVDIVRIENISNDASRLEIWMPFITSNEHQRLLDVRVESSLTPRITYDQEFGNKILYLEAKDPGVTETEVKIRYKILKHEYSVNMDPDIVGSFNDSELKLLQKYLRPERHVPVDDRIRKLALEIVGTEQNMIGRVKRIFDHVVEHMRYNASEQSWVGSAEHALSCSTGNCNDIHALFMSLCRSINIPSRLVMGYELVEQAENCEICGYHCWVEFFAPNLGWVPVDASCSTKYGKHGLFGSLEVNHVVLSKGRDIIVEPPQKGGPILFFYSAYTEVDGVKHIDTNRNFTFRVID
ncbi:MAG: hypothetical protein CMO16_04925 [Thaumarchaeota archaeon]|nr:hypothetical protein [Nitrososphaerota archaeon]|tara:strand:- start:1539 stop:2450 length:912 start_codon:yes stop_codon:yes gene_type:complete